MGHPLVLSTGKNDQLLNWMLELELDSFCRSHSLRGKYSEYSVRKGGARIDQCSGINMIRKKSHSPPFQHFWRVSREEYTFLVNGVVKSNSD